MTPPRPPISERLAALRAEMRAAGIDAYVVPTSDAHQNEYGPTCWQRRAWISGFTGSAGLVAVTAAGAGLWTDSRYFLQAETELDPTAFTLFRSGQPDVQTLDEWLCDTLSEG